MTDDVTKQGSVTTMVSSGSKKDSADNVPGSQADPALVKEEIGEPKTFPEMGYSKVGVTYGLTKSLGNFEFVRIDVSAEDFCAPDQKVETWNKLKGIVAEFVQNAVADIDKYVAEKKNPKKDKMGF